MNPFIFTSIKHNLEKFCQITTDDNAIFGRWKEKSFKIYNRNNKLIFKIEKCNKRFKKLQDMINFMISSSFSFNIDKNEVNNLNELNITISRKVDENINDITVLEIINKSIKSKVTFVSSFPTTDSSGRISLYNKNKRDGIKFIKQAQMQDRNVRLVTGYINVNDIKENIEYLKGKKLFALSLSKTNSLDEIESIYFDNDKFYFNLRMLTQSKVCVSIPDWESTYFSTEKTSDKFDFVNIITQQS